MTAFASVAQYRLKYGSDMSDAELEVWLGDASDIMAFEMDRAGVDYSAPSEEFATRLCRVCRDMVHRAIGDGSQANASIPFGATQASMSAGGYSESFTIGNPYGELFLKERERVAIGVGIGGFAVAVPPFVNAEVPDD